LADELRHYWDVETADLPMRGDYGWGFVKLEVLFGPPGETFLVLDSDTVITGPILELWDESHGSFLVDEESQSEADTKRLYYDWEIVRDIDPDARPSQFVFNSGQWFGTAGVLSRNDFAPWMEWTMPRKLKPPGVFMNGEQGILNYVLNQKATIDGLRVERRQIMRWPGHSMDGLDAETISKRAAAPLVVHWAGIKKVHQSDMTGAEVLAFFEKSYYQRLPAGEARRIFASYRDLLSHWLLDTHLRIKLTSRRFAGLRRGAARL
jgi:hypothetical protein